MDKICRTKHTHMYMWTGKMCLGMIISFNVSFLVVILCLAGSYHWGSWVKHTWDLYGSVMLWPCRISIWKISPLVLWNKIPAAWRETCALGSLRLAAVVWSPSELSPLQATGRKTEIEGHITSPWTKSLGSHSLGAPQHPDQHLNFWGSHDRINQDWPQGLPGTGSG